MQNPLTFSHVKARLRSKKILERLQQKPQQKKAKDLKICQKLSRSSAFQAAKTVLFYLPIHGEVDLELLFSKFSKKKLFALPRVQKSSLTLHYISSLQHTAPGKFKIREPHNHLKKAKPGDIDLILVPGVAFSKNGHRIGYGKGFYDRLLKKTKALKIGIAYDFQIVNNIPGETHDVPMDIIITEKQTLKVKAQNWILHFGF